MPTQPRLIESQELRALYQAAKRYLRYHHPVPLPVRWSIVSPRKIREQYPDHHGGKYFGHFGTDVGPTRAWIWIANNLRSRRSLLDTMAHEWAHVHRAIAPEDEQTTEHDPVWRELHRVLRRDLARRFL